MSFYTCGMLISTCGVLISTCAHAEFNVWHMLISTVPTIYREVTEKSSDEQNQRFSSFLNSFLSSKADKGVKSCIKQEVKR